MKPDRIDIQILQCLEKTARISNKQLARLIGLSESACLERVRRLEREQVILGYRAVISPTLRGDRIEAWADVSLADLSQDACKSFLKIIADTPAVAAAFQTSGAYDYLIYFAAPNLSQWRSFCHELGAVGIGAGRIRFALIVERPKVMEVLRDVLAGD